MGLSSRRIGGMGPYGPGRMGRPVFGRTLSGTLVPRNAGGVPITTVVKMEKRRVDHLEDRLEQLEGGVQELGELTVGRGARRRDMDRYENDLWDDESSWSSDMDDDDDTDSWDI